MKRHFKQQIDSIQAAYLQLDDTMYEEFITDCLRTIKSGHKIIATSLGKNVPICEKFVGTLNSLGISAHFMHTNSAVHGDLGMIQEGDMVIVMSKSGETAETIYLCEKLKARNSLDWLLSCNKNSTCTDLVDKRLILEVSQEGDPWNLVPNNSTLIFLVFLQSVCMEIIDKLPVDLDTFKNNHPGGSIGMILANRVNE